MVTPLEKFLAKHPTPSGMDSKEWAALNAAMKENKFFSSKKKKLTKKIAAELLDKGWCRVTGLYTPKRPQLYDAVIRLDDTGGKYVSFKMEFDK